MPPCGKVLLVLATVIAVIDGAAPHVHSVSVKGSLKCGNKQAQDVKAALYRVPADKTKVIAFEKMEETKVSPEGLFSLTANTNGRPLNETDLQPAIRFYHRCDWADGYKKDKVRSFEVAVPPDYVSLGKAAKKTFDIGTLNLELTYPDEFLARRDA